MIVILTSSIKFNILNVLLHINFDGEYDIEIFHACFNNAKMFINMFFN